MSLNPDEVKAAYAKTAFETHWKGLVGTAKAAPAFIVLKALNRGGLRPQAMADAAPAKGSSVLCLCFGTGHDLGFLKPYVGPDAPIVGIDFTPEMLERAKQRVADHGMTNVTLIQGDVTKELPVQGRLFDQTQCYAGLSVVPNWEGAYDNLVNHAKPGGTVLIYDFTLREGWRSVFNPLMVWGLKDYAGTKEGMWNFMRVAERARKDPRLENVGVHIQRYAGWVKATRRAD